MQDDAAEELYDARSAATRCGRMVWPGLAIGLGAMAASIVPFFVSPLPVIAYGVLTFGSIAAGGLAAIVAVAAVSDYRRVVAGMGVRVWPVSLMVYVPSSIALGCGILAALAGVLGFLGFEVVRTY